jgi:hypothetical protein
MVAPRGPPKATSHGCFFSKVGNYVSSKEPQDRYIEITTKPRTQGIIYQTLLGGGAACLAWQRGEMQETVMESLFAPTASSPNYYAFCPPRGRI